MKAKETTGEERMTLDQMEKLEKLLKDPQQIGKDYIVVRVIAVHVKKRLFGLHDIKEVGRIVCIPSDRSSILKIFDSINLLFQKYGVEYTPDKKTFPKERTSQ
jgi:hypothetical protein